MVDGQKINELKISDVKREKLLGLLNRFKQLKINLIDHTFSFTYGFRTIKLDINNQSDVIYYENEDIKDSEVVDLVNDYKYIVSRIERYLRSKS